MKEISGLDQICTEFGIKLKHFEYLKGISGSEIYLEFHARFPTGDLWDKIQAILDKLLQFFKVPVKTYEVKYILSEDYSQSDEIHFHFIFGHGATK